MKIKAIKSKTKEGIIRIDYRVAGLVISTPFHTEKEADEYIKKKNLEIDNDLTLETLMS